MRVKSSRGKRWLKAAAGLALAPSAAAALWAAVLALGEASGGRSASWFWGGAAGYGLLYAAGLARLRRVYVFAHELTHAYAAWLLGGKVYKLNVRRESGFVELSESGVFISLAPYWIPAYPLAAAAAYRLLSGAVEGPLARGAFFAVMGAGLAFHAAHTAESLLGAHQSDLDAAGAPLSLSLIALGNGLLGLLVLKCLFPSAVHAGSGLARAASLSVAFWRGLGGLWAP